MAVRLRDVAELAGVSVKTVSNVVNGYPTSPEAMRRRVQDALDEAGYRPNATARSLRTGRTGLIGLAVPRLHDPYFAQLADAVIAAAAEQGWTVYLASGENFPDALAGRRWPVTSTRRCC
jgi:DNA-binding LacI/PurR family transcriptional regulator